MQKPEIRSKMSVLKRATEDEIKKLFRAHRQNHVIWTPIPTSVLTNSLDITDIINTSMKTITFSQNFKEIQVRPLFKITSLAKNKLKNYRAVSSLNFISKILEKVVAYRPQAHIKNNNSSNPLQSTYRKHHCTEWALLKVHNNVIISMDKYVVTALTMLDLSASFDTIDATLTDIISDFSMEYLGRLKFSFLLI